MMIVAALAMLTLTTAPAAARPCLTQAQAHKAHPGKIIKYRQIGETRCWYAGRTPAKSEFKLPAPSTLAASRPPKTAIKPTRTTTLVQSDDGMDNVLATLCGGPCPDFRGMDLYGMQARLEAAHAAFMFLQAMR